MILATDPPGVPNGPCHPSNLNSLTDVRRCFHKDPPSIPGDKEIDKSLGITQSEIMDNLDKLVKEGYDLNPKTGKVKLPDGSTVNPKDLPSGDQNKGLSANAIKKIQETEARAAALVNKALAKSKSRGPGRGGYSSSLSNRNSQDEDDMFRYNGIRQRLNSLNKRAPTSVKGLKKAVGNDDMIGVSGDNIFEMIARRYNKMDREGIFLKEKR